MVAGDGRPRETAGLSAGALQPPTAPAPYLTTDEKPRPDILVVELHQEVACLLGHPAAIRIGRDPSEVDAAGRQFHEEQDVEALEEERVDGEEVALEDAGCLRA